MEIYKTTSLHKIDFWNCFINTFFIFIYSIIGFYSIDYIINQTKKFLNFLIEKNILKKGSFFLNLISDLIFILITLIELIIINYIIRIISFLTIREKIFEYLIFNFKTLSNIKDLKSFTELNCFEFNININFKDITKGNFSNLLDLNFFICSFQILDKFYLEYLLCIFTFLYIFYENLNIYRNNRNLENIYSFYKQIIYLYILLQISYFFFSYIWLYSIKINNNIIKIEENDIFNNNNSYNNFDNIIINTKINSNVNEYLDIDIDKYYDLKLNTFDNNIIDEYSNKNSDIIINSNIINEENEDYFYSAIENKEKKKTYIGNFIHKVFGETGTKIFESLGDILELLADILEIIS